MKVRSLALASILAASSAAHAQPVTPSQALQAADTAKKADKLGTLSGSAGFGMIGEDLYATLQLRLSFDFDNWGLGVGVPIRLRLYDFEPESPMQGAFRAQDWDEPSDFFRVLRYVYVGKADKSGPYYLRFGELSGLTLGHGTIVNRFSNGFDLDRFRFGADMHFRVGPYTGELVIGDMARPKDTVMVGVRATVRPLMVEAYHGAEVPDGEPKPPTDDGVSENLASRLIVGLTIMTDPTAPRELACTPKAGADVASARSPCDPRVYRVQTIDESPRVARDEVLGMMGVDVGYELLRTSLLSITPYMDINNLMNVENGWGLHLGVFWSFRVPLVLDTLTLDLRTEYRRVSGDYVGPYFDATYAVERFESPQGGGLTKLQSLRTPVRLANGTLYDPRNLPAKNGLFFDVLAGLPSYVFIGGEYIDYDGDVPDGTLRLSLQIPALTYLQLNAYYLRTRIDGTSDLFKLDDRSAIVAEAAVPLGEFLQLQARWWRLWRAGPDGNFESVDDWSVGVGVSLDF